MVLNSLSFCLSVKLLKVMATSFKRSHACTATLCAPNPAVPTGDSWTLLRKPGSDSCGVTTPFSWVLVCTRFCLHPPRVYFPFLCKFWQLWLMATSSKRAYAIPKSTAPKSPASAAVHCWPIPPQETLKHSSVSVFVGSLGPGVHKVCLNPLNISRRYGVWF